MKKYILASKFIFGYLLFVLVVSGTAKASQVMFLQTEKDKPYLKNQVELVSKFYGLDVQYLTLGSKGVNIQNISKDNKLLAVLISPKALNYISPKFIDGIKKEIPFLVLGITSNNITSKNLINWSGGAISNCTINPKHNVPNILAVNDNKKIARQLSGQKIPYQEIEGYHFITVEKGNFQIILENKNNDKTYPIFFKTKSNGREIFLSTKLQTSPKKVNRVDLFVEIAPLFIFLKYAGGDYCWHAVENSANLTIDDPWLTKSYGYLNYEGLLKEMEAHNFHTTIAFTPWNFDRSEPEVVSLFRDHPDRFSICIHGNNHDHYEFYKYKTDFGDPWPAKPLKIQRPNIEQALARMDKFQNLTGLPYDRVMVFPHGIAPAETLGVLKKYNFLATVNSGNVPLGSQKPSDPFFDFRKVTLQFENFPSINRFSAKKVKDYDIFIDLFLDNPILYYCHQDFFEKGIDAFNSIAGTVNSIQPDIVWQSLGNVVHHFYLEKLREDGNYDILAYSSDIILTNKHSHDTKYILQKEEAGSILVKQVTVQGQTYPYNSGKRKVFVTVDVPKGKSQRITIVYQNQFDLSSVDISKNDFRINLLRKFSDFRDLILSRNAILQAFVNFYYKSGFYKFGIKRLLIVFALLVTAVFFVCLSVRKRRKVFNCDGFIK